MNEWISPWDKMPNIGDCIYVTDGKEMMKIKVLALPTDPWNSNVIGWRYVDDDEDESYSYSHRIP